MVDSVTVTVPARIHLGFLDIDGSLGRRFGSLGLALERPSTRLTLAHAARASVEGPDSERAGRHLASLKRALNIAAQHALKIETAIPSHSGLGSGTQLALATAAALRRLHGLPPDVRADAERLGRGQRSGVGIGLFERGGLMIDGGRVEGGGPAPIIARLPFPEDWRVLLVYDRAAKGIHGQEEVSAFAHLPPFPQATAAHLCHLVLLKAMPAVAERDIAPFGDAIAALQRAVGDHFAAAQGGRFTSPRVAAAMAELEAAGAHGAGQSSWGPTGFAFADSAQRADRLAQAVTGLARSGEIAVDIVRASNRGASVTVKEGAELA